MAEELKILSSSAQPIDYAPARRRSRWIRALPIVVPVLGILIWFRQPIRDFAASRLAIYQLYKSQVACEVESARVGEIVLRTDGSTAEIQNPVPYTLPAGRPIPISKPVLRGSAGYQEYCSKVSLLSSGPTGGAWVWSQALMPGRSDISLVDCGHKTTESGDTVLGWVTISASDNRVEIQAFTTPPATLLQLPDLTPFKLSTPPPVSMEVNFRPLVGPLTVRRVEAQRPQDVQLLLQQAGGELKVIAEWNGDHCKLKQTTGNSTADSNAADSSGLIPVASAIPEIKVRLQQMLSEDLQMSEALAADERGIVILSQSRYGSDLRYQVHRMDWNGGRLTEVLPASSSLFRSVLSRDGSRLACNQTADSFEWNGPRKISVIDLKRKTTHVLQYTGGRSISDDGHHLIIAGLRTPIQVFDDACNLTETIPCDRADFLSVNGRYLARVQATSSLDVYDLQAHLWSRALENPWGETEVLASPDGQLLCCGPNAWCVLDVATGNLVTTLEDQQLGRGAVEHAIFSPDGRWLVRTGIDVFLFDLRNRATPRRMKLIMPTAEFESLAAFSPDSRCLILLRQNALSVLPLDGL